MMTIPKSEFLEIIEVNPSMLIGKEIISKNISGSSVKIVDVNLKCNHIFIEEHSNKTHKWINVNDLDDDIICDSLDRHDKPQITIKTLMEKLQMKT